MGICPNCSTDNDEGSIYCFNCGTQFFRGGKHIESGLQTENYHKTEKSVSYSNKFDNYNNSNNYNKIHSRHLDFKFLVAYEIIIGFFIFQIALFQFSRLNDPVLKNFDLKIGMYQVQLYFIIGLVITLWGFYCLITALLLLLKKPISLNLSRILLFSTGLLLFWALIPFFMMLVFLVYLHDSDSFKFNNTIGTAVPH